MIRGRDTFDIDFDVPILPLDRIQKYRYYKFEMNTSFKNAREKMESLGVRPTSIRVRVLELLTSRRAHLSADEVYSKLTSAYPVLSKTSVYNALHLLAEKGLVNEVAIGSSETKFEGARDPHHHFYCTECHSITDIDVSCPFFKKDMVEGNRITELHGYFKGVCSKCLKKK